MTPVVVDVSAIVPLAFDDEDQAYSSATVRAVALSGGVVPALFWFEVWNVLATNETRRGRTTQAKTGIFLEAVEGMALEIAPLPDAGAILGLARAHGITAYDAAYLELAKRLGSPLATQDRSLRQAAVAAGVGVFTPPAAA